MVFAGVKELLPPKVFSKGQEEPHCRSQAIQSMCVIGQNAA
jgi:hypothetical protein